MTLRVSKQRLTGFEQVIAFSCDARRRVSLWELDWVEYITCDLVTCDGSRNFNNAIFNDELKHNNGKCLKWHSLLSETDNWYLFNIIDCDMEQQSITIICTCKEVPYSHTVTLWYCCPYILSMTSGSHHILRNYDRNPNTSR